MDIATDHIIAIRTLEALGFATGADLCLVMAFLQWRSRRADGGPRFLIALWIAGLLWTGGSLARAVLVLAGYAESDPLVRAVQSIAWTSTASGSFVTPRAFYRAPPGGSRLRSVMIGTSTLIGAVFIVLFLLSGFFPSLGLSTNAIAIGSFYNALLNVVVFAPIGLARRFKAGPKPPSARWAAPMLWASVALVAALVAANFIGIYGPDSLGWIKVGASLLSEQWAIPVTVLVAATMAKTHYADVVLKRSLLVIVSIALAGAVAWRLPSLPLGLPTVIAALIGAGLIMAAPGLHKTIGWLVERVLLRKPAYGPLALNFGDEARRTGTPAELAGLAEQRIGTALDLEARLVPPEAEDAPPPADAERVTLKGGRLVELSPKRRAQALMQAEHSFLDAIGDELSRREETLAFEAERREREGREARLTHAVTQAELKALRAQVDPHFLFNTLNAIADLISSAPEKAETMTERLAAFFRYTLTRQERTLSTLDEELDFARLYLEIEQARFGDRLKVSIDKSADLGAETVPSLILQPLVENAVRHGLSSKREGGTVRVVASRSDGRLRLEVADDGVGFKDASKPGVGLANVRERLRALHGEAASMTVGKGASGRGTSIVLEMPA